MRNILKYGSFVLVFLLIVITCTKPSYDDKYDIKTIKEGHKRVNEAPHILKQKDYYMAQLLITGDLYLVDDSQDRGWSKLWGVCFIHPHLNSFRFVFRNQDGLKLGYYSYVNKTSPQENQFYKGYFDTEVKLHDIITMELFFEDSTVYRLTTPDTVIEVKQPLPIGYRRPMIECLPNIKCEASADLDFLFLY